MPRKRKNERSDGRIQIQLDIGRDANGKRVRKYFYGDTRAEAERKKAEYLGIRASKPAAPITLSDWIDEYRAVYPSRANPLYEAQNAVPFNRLRAALGDRDLDTILEADLQRFINGMSDYSASTISKQLQVVKAVFAKARKNKLIPDNPAEDLTAPRGTKGTHRALTQDEIKLICDRWQSCPAGLWCMVMLFAGLRRGEMIALDWSAVDMDERTLTVKQTAVLHNNRAVIQPRAKTRAGTRIIPLVRPLFDTLVTVPPERRNGALCLSAASQPLSETALRRGIEHFIRILGFSFRCHDLRHTFATLLYDSGVDVQTAAYLLGHSDVTVTMRIYTHLSEQRKTRSTAALLDYFSGIK